MNDDYLWDGSGPPDPDIQRLEQLLGPLRATVSGSIQLPPSLKRRRASVTVDALQWRSARFLAPALAAAAAIVLMVSGTWNSVRFASKTSSSWAVAAIEGRPRIGSTALAGSGRLTVGEILVTDAVSRARVEVSTIGEVTVDPDSRVQLVATRDGHHRLALESGTLRAVITAPPGQFVVDTPSATATDLGCAYTLHVDEDGSGLLTVTAGWVSLQLAARESFVPAGASARIDRALGPGTPRYDDEDREYQDAIDTFDFSEDPARRAAALRALLTHPHSGDAVTLWHLLPRVDEADRAAVADALADQVAMPAGVTRDQVLRLDRDALDAWWNALGLGDATWWRKWKLTSLDRPSP
jgi:FecR-like protein